MYYVLMTDLVRVPTPSLDNPAGGAPPQYLFGLSITGHMAQNAPDTSPPTTTPTPVVDQDLKTRLDKMAAAATGGNIVPAIASELGPIAPWTWTSFDKVMLTDGTSFLQVPVIPGPNLDSA